MQKKSAWNKFASSSFVLDGIMDCKRKEKKIRRGRSISEETGLTAMDAPTTETRLLLFRSSPASSSYRY